MALDQLEMVSMHCQLCFYCVIVFFLVLSSSIHFPFPSSLLFSHACVLHLPRLSGRCWSTDAGPLLSGAEGKGRLHSILSAPAWLLTLHRYLRK